MKIIKNWTFFIRYSKFSKKEELFITGNVYNHFKFPDGSLIITSSIVKIDKAEITTLSGTMYKLENPKAETLLAEYENKHGYIETFCVTFSDFILNTFSDNGDSLIKLISEIKNENEWADYAYRSDWTFGIKRVSSLGNLTDILSNYDEEPLVSYTNSEKFTENALNIIRRMCKDMDKKIIIYPQNVEIKDFIVGDKDRVLFDIMKNFQVYNINYI